MALILDKDLPVIGPKPLTAGRMSDIMRKVWAEKVEPYLERVSPLCGTYIVDEKGQDLAEVRYDVEERWGSRIKVVRR